MPLQDTDPTPSFGGFGLKSRRMKVALDTTYILGRGAVKDTYNLLSDGIVKLVRALSEVERSDLDEWAAARDTRDMPAPA